MSRPWSYSYEQSRKGGYILVVQTDDKMIQNGVSTMKEQGQGHGRRSGLHAKQKPGRQLDLQV